MTPSEPIPHQVHADLLQLGMASDHDAWPPSPERLARSFEHFEFISMLGQGGAGAVYRVRRLDDGRELALKLIRPDLIAQSGLAARFLREAEALRRLDHPRIVRIEGFGEHEGWFFLEMEYVRGQSLRMLMDGPMSPKRALDIVDGLCEALEFAHELGVVHRDIKPENVLIDGEGEIKLADFGLAKLRDADAQWTLTGSHMLLGTPLYLAPEQIHSPQSVDHRVDIYSVGVVLYEALTERLPMGRVATPSKVAKVDRRVDRALMRALEPDPDRRFGEIAEFRRALGRGRVVRGLPSRRLLGSGAVVFGVLGVALTAALATARAEEPKPFDNSIIAASLAEMALTYSWRAVTGEGLIVDLQPKPAPESHVDPAPFSDHSEDADTRWAAAEKARRERRWADARRAYDHFLAEHPHHRRAEQAHFLVGRMYFEGHDYKEAARAFWSYLVEREAKGTQGRALYYAGLSFAKLGRCRDAILYFETIAAKDKYSADIRARAREQIESLTIMLGDDDPRCIADQDGSADVPTR